MRVDGAERRPGRREHFSCLGSSRTTPGCALNQKCSLARCRPNTPKYRQINDVAVFECACIRLTHRIPEAWLSVCFAVRPCLRRASPAAARARLHGPCGVARGGSGVCALDPPRRRRRRRRTADVGPRRRRTEESGRQCALAHIGVAGRSREAGGSASAAGRGAIESISVGGSNHRDWFRASRAG